MEMLIEGLMALARHGEQADATLVVDTDRTVRADPSRVEQLLEKPFCNVTDHWGAAVTVQVGDTDDGILVADDRPGISADEREQVFESGYSTSEEGVGVGLSIVQEIVEAHDWDVRVTESADGGARFAFVGVEVG